MSESQTEVDVPEVPAVPEATDIEQAAAAQPNAEAPDSGTGTEQDGSAQTVKTFTQEQVDAIAAKERAIAERKAERRAAKEYERRLEETLSRIQQPQPKQAEVTQPGKPKLEDFQKVEDYVEAISDWKLRTHQENQAREAEAAQAQRMQYEVSSKARSVIEMAEENPEFDSVAFERLPVTDAMAYAIMESDLAPKVMVFLQNNPGEVDRIARLAPARQAAEIGKLEVKLAAPPKAVASNAPAPVKPIGQRGTGTAKDPQKMSQAEFERWLGYAK